MQGLRESIIPKVQLLQCMKRFVNDTNRGISIALFCEVAGLSEQHFYDVFYNESSPMTEQSQIRVSRAYNAWLRGELRVMQNKNKTRYVEYRKTPEPKIRRSMGLEVKDGAIKLKVGLRNKADYMQPTLEEQLGGKNGKS